MSTLDWDDYERDAEDVRADPARAAR